MTNNGIEKEEEIEEVWSEIMEKSPNKWPPFFLQNQPKSGKMQQKIKEQIRTGDGRKKKAGRNCRSKGNAMLKW